MKYTRNILLVALTLLGLAACGGGAPASGDQLVPSQPTTSALPPTAAPEPTGAAQPVPASTAQPTALPPQPTATPQPAGDTAAIAVFHKSGGIMGLDETLTVQADGTLVLKRRGADDKTAQLAPAQLGQLRALIASPEFTKLKPRYQAAGADLFTYTISVPGGTPASVTTMDGVQNPPVLDQVLQELNRLREQM